VHRAGEVHGGVAGTNRTGHGLRGVEAHELQRVGIAESIEAVVAAERAAAKTFTTEATESTEKTQRKN